jgi:ADP-ribose pyrophosphatase YjhB (NUDIX family)
LFVVKGHDNQAVSIRIRVAACLTEEDRILLVTHEKAGHRYQLLPGGGVNDHETLDEAVRREVLEETGFAVKVGALILVCESIDPAGDRHILNLIFRASLESGNLKPGLDGTLCDAGWITRNELASAELYPDIARQLLRSWDQGFTGPVPSLGNVWKQT